MIYFRKLITLFILEKKSTYAHWCWRSVTPEIWKILERSTSTSSTNYWSSLLSTNYREITAHFNTEDSFDLDGFFSFMAVVPQSRTTTDGGAHDRITGARVNNCPHHRSMSFVWLTGSGKGDREIPNKEEVFPIQIYLLRKYIFLRNWGKTRVKNLFAIIFLVRFYSVFYSVKYSVFYSIKYSIVLIIIILHIILNDYIYNYGFLFLNCDILNIIIP